MPQKSSLRLRVSAVNNSSVRSQIDEVVYAMSNSFGFGGHNATLLFKKMD